MLLNADDYRRQARRRLPRGLFEYIDRGSEDEQALSRLRRSLDRIALRPRILTGPNPANLEGTLFGKGVNAPLIVAPTALAGLVSYEGEIKLARAAQAVGIPYCTATQAITPIEAVRRGAPDVDLWFQLYVWRDRDLMRGLLARARACGCETLVVTVDNQVAPNREYNVRNGFSMPIRPSIRNALDVGRHPRWLLGVLLRYLSAGGMPSYGNYPPAFRSTVTRPSVADAVQLETALGWEDIARIRDAWPGRIVLKGVLSLEDAVRAVDGGIEGLVVSSHGGRNLDCTTDPTDGLPDIAEAVGERTVVIADSGIRRGTDVLKYLALGARATMLGRLPLWGLAVEGQEGAEAILRMLVREMRTAMGYLGAAAVFEIAIAAGSAEARSHPPARQCG